MSMINQGITSQYVPKQENQNPELKYENIVIQNNSLKNGTQTNARVQPLISNEQNLYANKNEGNINQNQIQYNNSQNLLNKNNIDYSNYIGQNNNSNTYNNDINSKYKSIKPNQQTHAQNINRSINQDINLNNNSDLPNIQPDQNKSNKENLKSTKINNNLNEKNQTYKNNIITNPDANLNINNNDLKNTNNFQVNNLNFSTYQKIQNINLQNKSANSFPVNINNNPQYNIDSNNLQGINNNINNNPQKISNNFIQNSINQNNLDVQGQQQNNNSLPNKNINDGKFHLSRYTKESKTGLINLVETSYLNAILRIISSIGSFASFFLNPLNQKMIRDSIKTKPLSFVIQRLFFHLYPYPENNNPEKYKPDAILELLGILNVVYKSNKKRNPNDLIHFILDTLHNELNEVKKNEQKLIQDQYDKKKVVDQGISNFINYNKSKISDILNWFEIKESKCSKCGKKSYNFYTFNIFELDILSTYEFRKSHNSLTLFDCLDYFIAPKPQNLFCKICNQYTQMSNTSKIYSSPPYFIFSLDRKNNDDNLMRIQFYIQEQININNYLENKNSYKAFRLTGITYFSLKEKKYLSFCKSPVDQKWYEYNDEIVLEKEISNILKEHQNDYIPCLLVYKFENK